MEQNRNYMLGVIGSGNTNFGPLFGIAADIVAKKCDVPVSSNLSSWAPIQM